MSYTSAAKEALLFFLTHSRDTLARLKAWCVRKPRTLRSLRVSAFTVSLDDDLHCLTTTIQSWGPETPPLTETDPHWLKIKTIKWKIHLALKLLDDHSDLESSAEDAWLDSLHLYIVDYVHPRRQAVRQQIAEESLALLSRVFGPNDGQRTRVWDLHDVPLAELAKVAQDLRDTMSDITSRSDVPFRPRSIFSYATATDAKFEVDPHTEAVEGTYAKVQKVRCQLTGRVMARKTFEPYTVRTKQSAILNELAILELCHHPNIVTLVEAYEVVEDPGTLHIVMEPWAPFTLHQFLYHDADRKKACPWFMPGDGQSSVVIYHTMLKLAEAIGYLHKLSIKHKDIKPMNILLQPTKMGMVPYVTDVGISKVYIKGQNTGYTNSTYDFLAPEQVNHKHSSLVADIWQLGCCFAKLLALAQGGTAAVFDLVGSYSDHGRSCCIATEVEWFMRELESILKKGNAAQQRGHQLVKRMLDHDIERRIDIRNVKVELEQLIDTAMNVEDITDAASTLNMV